MSIFERPIIKIRRAQLSDCVQLAMTHIKCWQQAYKDLLPCEYLEGLTSETTNREKMWISILNNPQRWAWVAEFSGQIIGFVLFGPPRDEHREGFIELGAIYILEEFKNQKIGYRLIQIGFEEMARLGFKKCYCWMLENNPTLLFYERTGGIKTARTKQDEIGGKIFNEIAIEWTTLKL